MLWRTLIRLIIPLLIDNAHLQFLTLSQQVNCVVFDKTGTLTIGAPVVVNANLFKDINIQEFTSLAAAVEVCTYIVD